MKASLLVLLMIAYPTWSFCNGDNNNKDVSGGNCVKNNGKGHCCNGDNSAKANSRDNCNKNGNNFELLSSSGNNYIRSIFSVDNGDSSQTGFSPLFSCVVAQLHFVSNNLTWADAQNYCRTNYTDLVTIKKENETQSLLNISGKQEFWIGLKRYNDNWQWSNKDEVTYSKWKRDFFCAFVQSDGSWNDTFCHENFTFMCYKETTNINERYFWINERMMWSKAQNYCRVNYTDLVSIRNESENEVIKNKSQGTPFWIGLFNNPWKWSDGGNSTFRNWSVDNPNNFKNNEKCVEINFKGNAWNDADCNSQKSFFCNSSCGPSSQQYVSQQLTWSGALNYCKVNCSGTLITVKNEAMNKNLSNWCTNSAWIGLRHEYDNWNWSNSNPVTYTNWKRTFSCAVLQSDGSWNDSDCNALNPFLCYNETDNSNGRFFWINISMTWSSAQNYCQVYYTDLASIRNESENNAAMEKIQNITSWIGLFNNPWKWSDGQDFTFQNWTLQQANIYQNNETCVKATSNGDWKAIDCSTKEPFICSNTIMNAIFINKSSTWEEALDYCTKNNSTLISISSQVEQDAIAALVNTTNSPNVWLGLRQSRLFGFWFWIDEKPLSYEQWVNGSPSQLPASSPCAVMSQANNFNWINVSCSETYSFICRYK